MKKTSVLSVMCSALLTIGCMQKIGGTVFKTTVKDIKTGKGSIAVLAGSSDEQVLVMARYATEAFAKKTRFDVMSQEQIGKRISGYPFNIQGPYRSAYKKVAEDFSLTDVNKLRTLQQRLGVKYLYVIWNPLSLDSGLYETKSGIPIGNRYAMVYRNDEVSIIGQLFECPAMNEVGRTNGRYIVLKEKAGNFIVASAIFSHEEGMTYFFEKVADRVGKNTGMGK